MVVHWLTSGGNTVVSAAHTKNMSFAIRASASGIMPCNIQKNFNLFNLSFNIDPGWGDASSNFNFLFCELALCFEQYNTILHTFFRDQLLSKQILYQPSLQPGCKSSNRQQFLVICTSDVEPPHSSES